MFRPAACLLALPLLLLASSAPIFAFDDIPETDPDRDAIERVTGLGVMEGFDGRFHPEKLINRYQMAVIGKRVLDLVDFSPPALTPPAVKDVAGTHWATKAILRVLEAGVMQPASEEHFLGQKLVSRYQLAGILAGLLRGMRDAGETLPDRRGKEGIPTDLDPDQPMADPTSVEEALAYGLMETFPGGEFAGSKLVNRRHMAQSLHRLLPSGLPTTLVEKVSRSSESERPSLSGSTPVAPEKPRPAESVLEDHARELARLQLELLKLRDRVEALEAQKPPPEVRYED